MRSLSLVIPVYGKVDVLENILGHVCHLKESAAKAGFDLIEAIVVDDGCHQPIDAAACSSLVGGVPVVVLSNGRNRGKGYSVRRGALAAKGEWVLMSDVDESVPLTEFDKLAPFADRAIACGSRRGGMDVRPWHRRVLSRMFSVVNGTGLRDSQCGFKLFNMALMRAVFEDQKTERFAFDVELIRKAPSIAEVPVVWRGGGRSSLRVWRDAPRMLWDLIRIRRGSSARLASCSCCQSVDECDATVAT